MVSVLAQPVFVETLQQVIWHWQPNLLGRPYSITGRVQYGDQIGRTLRFSNH